MRIAFFIVSFMVSSSLVKGQQIPNFYSKINNEYLYNPGAIGINENASVNLGGLRQGDKMTDAPFNSYLTIEGRIKKTNSSIGLNVMTDNTAYLNQYKFGVSYAYLLGFDSLRHKLSIGVSAGLHYLNTNTSKANVTNIDDPYLLSYTGNATHFDFAVGIHYQFKRLKANLSVMQLQGNKLDLSSNQALTYAYTQKQHLYFSTFYAIPLSKGSMKHVLEPSFHLAWVAGLSMPIDLNLAYKYMDLFTVSVGGRYANDFQKSSQLVSGFTFKLYKRALIGYNFAMPLSSTVSTYFGNSHEVYLSYLFQNKR
jgi:type IX secretion system PorP/SprF family membrane protein